MADQRVNGNLILIGSSGGTIAFGCQPSGGGFTILLPTTVPQVGQTLVINSVYNGNTATAQWAVPAVIPSVTSVALTAPSIFTVAGSPVTTTGVLALGLENQVVHSFFAGPASGSMAVPTFRPMTIADLPASGTPSSTTFLRGDGTWAVPLTTFVTSFNGRSGVVVAQAGDYAYDQISNLPQLAVTPVVPSHEWLNGYSSTTGLFSFSQPASTDLSDAASLAYLASPTFTGTVTLPAVSVTGALTYTSVNPTFFAATGTGDVVLASAPTITSGTFAGTTQVTDVVILGSFTDNDSSAGTSGQVLTAGTGGQVVWAPASSFDGTFSGTTGISLTDDSSSGVHITENGGGAISLSSDNGIVLLNDSTSNGIAITSTGGSGGISITELSGGGIAIAEIGGGLAISDNSTTGISITESNASGTLTLSAPTGNVRLGNAPLSSDNSDAVATTSYVRAQGYGPLVGSPWSNLGAAASNLTLANTTFTTTFDQTTPAAWTWANVSPSTGSPPTNEDSPILSLQGTYWTGSASATDGWSFQHTHGAGTNPGSTLRVIYSGGTVNGGMVIENGNTANSGANFPAPILGVQGSIWDGAAAQVDEWQMVTINSGTSNPGSKFRIQHNGPTTGTLTALSVGQSINATSGANNSSPFSEWQGTYWNGSASTSDLWTVQNVLGTGANPTSTLTFAHSGTSGVATITFPSVIINLGAAQITAAGSVRAGGALNLGWVNRAQMQSVADGQITMTNNAQTVGAQLTTGSLVLSAVTPAAGAGQVSLGTTTATSATAGTNGAVPAEVVGYLEVNIGGTVFKIPYFNS